MDRCFICQKNSVNKLMDFGHQPISNRFLQDPLAYEEKYLFCLGICQYCSLLQLINPVSSNQIKSRYSWIKYNEPEDHLDTLAKTIIKLPGISQDSIICGISGYEASLLSRLNKKGFSQTWLLNLQEDLNIHDTLASTETIQEKLTIDISHQLLEKKKRPQVVIARSILEHAHSPMQFMKALQNFVQPDGYIIFEVPDITPSLETFNYGVLWEEHILYFTPFSLAKCLEMGGFELCSLAIYPTVMENALVAITRVANNKDKSAITIDSVSLKEAVQKAITFTQMLSDRKKWFRKKLSRYKQESKIALLGAGHLACYFINLLELSDLIDFIIDDNMNKIGLFMPGSRLPILPSSTLETQGVKLCLMSLNPESEKKVISKNQKFIADGGKFLSIFASSSYALT